MDASAVFPARLRLTSLWERLVMMVSNFVLRQVLPSSDDVRLIIMATEGLGHGQSQQD